MKKVNWRIVGIVAVLAAALFLGGGMMWGNRGYGMMGGYGMTLAPSASAGVGNWGYSPFGWFGMGMGMIFIWLIPIGILALLVFGAVSLVRNSGNPPQTATQTSCANCGKGTQADWRNCPYCATPLK